MSRTSERFKALPEADTDQLVLVMNVQLVTILSGAFLPLILASGEVKPVSPEHEALDATYHQQLSQNEETYQGSTEKLATSYVGALERLRLELERRGIKPVVETVQNEIERVEGGDVSGYPEEAFLPDKVRDLRAAFDKFHRKLAQDAGNADAVALYQYDMRLADLSSSIKADGDEDAYRSLLEFRQELLEPVHSEQSATEDTPPEPATPKTSDVPPDADGSEGPPRRKKPKFRRPVVTQEESNESRANMQRLAASLPRPMNDTELARHSASMGPRPTASADGSYTALVSSMGSVAELDPGKITAWGGPQPELAGDVGYWTITVNYQVQTMFGMFDTQGKALVRGGQVERWIYAGSGEQIH